MKEVGAEVHKNPYLVMHRKSECWEQQEAPSFSNMTCTGFERRNLSYFLSSSVWIMCRGDLTCYKMSV